VSLDAGQSWSTSILTQWAIAEGDPNFFYNGPCFISWWPNGEAFITSDSAATGHAYWWCSGPNNWGGPWFSPAILLNAVDPESTWPSTPWMGMVVSGTEAYCTTANAPNETAGVSTKEIIWRYNRTTGSAIVLADAIVNPEPDFFFKTLRWLSGSRHNRIPITAPFFFTSGNRRFPRLPRRRFQIGDVTG
jgi:hypothetical protein